MARFRKPNTSSRKFSRSSIPVIDISDDEDTISSQGTLNSIIPHPTDFEGTNNPFSNSESTTSSTISSTSASIRSSNSSRSSSTNTNAKSRASRSTSASTTRKSVVLRTSRSNSISSTSSKNTVPNTNTSDVSSNFSSKNAITSAIKSKITLRHSESPVCESIIPKSPPKSTRSASIAAKKALRTAQRLRARTQRKCTIPKSGSVIDRLLNDSSPNSSLICHKSSPASAPSSSDLNSSLSNYFGAAERIANGEKFSVLAKRIGPDGTIQYLVEWDGIAPS